MTERTEEEISAQVAKLLAEANSLTANANKANADAARANAETQRAIAEAEYAQSKTAAELREARRIQASDGNNRIYRFNGKVDEKSVDAAIYRLGEWSRLYPGEGIEIVFNSPGGSIIDGFALFDRILQLRADGHHVTTGTLGQAASMAGILIQAGQTRWVGTQSWYLIHRAGFGSFGSTYEVKDMVELIERMEKRIMDIFVDRSDITMKMIKGKWDRKDWWIDANEALELGLVDEIRGSGSVR